MYRHPDYEEHNYWMHRKLKQQYCSVYFIKNLSSGHIKIGWSSDPERRIKELQPGAEGKLVLMATQPGGVETEASIHKHFKDLLFYGEWYIQDSSLLSYISDVSLDKYRYFDKNGKDIDSKLVEYYVKLDAEEVRPVAC
jgi:hypothetical protein